MADNTVLSAGTADGVTVGGDSIGGVLFQRMKLIHGADNTNDGDVSNANPLPIKITDGTDVALVTVGGLLQVDASGVAVPITDNAGSLTVDGTVAVTNADLTTIAALSKAEDAAHSSGNTGVMALGVRMATATDLSAGNTDGDYEPFQLDANGRMHVNAGTVTVASHAVTNAGTFAVQAAEADGANVTLGSKADAKSTATDTTSITAMQVLKQISASVQAPPSQAVTNAGTFAVQEADGANTTLGAKADAKSTATDTTSISAMSVLKQISASVQAPPSQAVTNAGTFATQTVLRPETANGLTTFMATGADGSSILVATKQTIKASAGQIYFWYIYNPEAAVTFFHIYNTDTVTVGTTNPQITLAIPAGSAANTPIPQGLSFSTAMSCAATTTAGGNTAPATGLSVVLGYA